MHVAWHGTEYIDVNVAPNLPNEIGSMLLMMVVIAVCDVLMESPAQSIVGCSITSHTSYLDV